MTHQEMQPQLWKELIEKKNAQVLLEEQIIGIEVSENVKQYQMDALECPKWDPQPRTMSITYRHNMFGVSQMADPRKPETCKITC